MYSAGNKKGLSRCRVPVCATEFVRERAVDYGSDDLTPGTPGVHDNILVIAYSFYSSYSFPKINKRRRDSKKLEVLKTITY